MRREHVWVIGSYINEENHLDAVLDMPHHIDELLIRMSWLLVSDVENRSSRGQCGNYTINNVTTNARMYF